MQVIAKSAGLYDNDRKRVGAIFEMKNEHYQWKDASGKERTCSWVMPYDKFSKIRDKRLANGMKLEEAMDIESIRDDELESNVVIENLGPVASSQAARKAAMKKQR